MLINNKNERFTVEQQKDIVQRCNEAYDKGGADVLKLVAETAVSILDETPDALEYVKFTLHLLEAVRQGLQAAVAAAPEQPEENKLITV